MSSSVLLGTDPDLNGESGMALTDDSDGFGKSKSALPLSLTPPPGKEKKKLLFKKVGDWLNFGSFDGSGAERGSVSAGRQLSVRRGSVDASAGAGRTVAEGIRSHRHDAKGRLRLLETPVRGQVGRFPFDCLLLSF